MSFSELQIPNGSNQKCPKKEEKSSTWNQPAGILVDFPMKSTLATGDGAQLYLPIYHKFFQP